MSYLLHKRKRFVGLVMSALVVILILTACFPSTSIPALPTSTPTATLTPTPTVVWFPPTATHTPLPTTVDITTTPLQSQVLKQVIITDEFSTLAPWEAGNPGNGTVALGINEITLAITLPKGYLYSYRTEPVLSNFYAEITASPSICAGMDEYGILFRYNSPVDFYRFSLSCDGRTRLDKLVGGSASSPQPWLDSISVPRAAPSSSRLGIWIGETQMNFYINNELQFSVTDRMGSSGLIGVFARSAGENALTISFSDLVVYELQP
jgi:hypothetical protein